MKNLLLIDTTHRNPAQWVANSIHEWGPSVHDLVQFFCFVFQQLYWGLKSHPRIVICFKWWIWWVLGYCICSLIMPQPRYKILPISQKVPSSPFKVNLFFFSLNPAYHWSTFGQYDLLFLKGHINKILKYAFLST